MVIIVQVAKFSPLHIFLNLTEKWLHSFALSAYPRRSFNLWSTFLVPDELKHQVIYWEVIKQKPPNRNAVIILNCTLEMKQERASKFLFYIFEPQISLNSFILGQLLPLQIFFWIEVYICECPGTEWCSYRVANRMLRMSCL